MNAPVDRADFETATKPLGTISKRFGLTCGDRARPIPRPGRAIPTADGQSTSPRPCRPASLDRDCQFPVARQHPPSSPRAGYQQRQLPYDPVQLGLKAGAGRRERNTVAKGATAGQDPAVLGYGTVLDMTRWTRTQDAFASWTRHRHLGPAELGEVLPEPRQLVQGHRRSVDRSLRAQ